MMRGLGFMVAVGLMAGPLLAEGDPFARYQEEARTRSVQKRIFPGVNVHDTHLLGFIALYAEAKNVEAATTPSLRLICQPNGIIRSFYDLDLKTGRLTVVPGTHDQWQTWSFILPAEKFARVRALLQSREFAALPRESTPAMLDGTSYLIDYRTEKQHRWSLHRHSNERVTHALLYLLYQEEVRHREESP